MTEAECLAATGPAVAPVAGPQFSLAGYKCR
jgi:hypothetical protein